MLRAFTLTAIAVLAFGTQSAESAPKTVAIVNLSEATGSAEAATQARKTIEETAGLRANTPGDLARALADTVPQHSPDDLVLAEAAQALEAAETAFTSFKSRQARKELLRARELLFGLPPGEASTRLLADVSFKMALLHLRDENRGLAMGELQLLHRLDERTSIDPVRYPPDVVRAFKTALQQTPRTPSAAITVSATYDGAPVYIDGRAVGASPLTLKVTPGVHIVAIAAPQYQAAARTIEIDAGGKQVVRVDLKPRSPVTRALELRYRAKEAGLSDKEIRQAAMQASRLVGSDAVLVLLRGPKDETSQAALYIQHLDRLSFARAVDGNLASMFGLVLDVPRPELLEVPTTTPGLVPWYKRPLVVGAIGGTLALTLAGILSATTSKDIKPDRLGMPVWDF